MEDLFEIRPDDMRQPKRKIPESSSPSDNLTPNSPRAQRLMDRFKKIIVQHMGEVGNKTTAEFVDDFALELWQETRK